MKAWVLRMGGGLSWPEIQERTTNVLGEAAGDKAACGAVACIKSMEDGAFVPSANSAKGGQQQAYATSLTRRCFMQSNRSHRASSGVVQHVVESVVLLMMAGVALIGPSLETS